MNCATLTSDDVRQLAELFVLLAVACGVLGYVGGWVLVHVSDWVIGLFRKRGAAAPFAERAKRLEERHARALDMWVRILKRNRREAMRRGYGGE